MRYLATLLLASSVAVAQTATVANLSDAGAGSLRAALTAANLSQAATFTIDITAGATAGPIVLASILPSLTRANVTIRALSGASRLVIDARPPTASSGYGLELAGNGIQLQAPCRVLVQQGNGVVVRGTNVVLADVEAVGNQGGQGIVAVAGADDLVIGRCLVDGFSIGLSLVSCDRAHIADDPTSTAEIRNSGGAGIQISNGADHRIGSFACINDELGISASNTPRLRLGRAGSPPSQVLASRQQGILLLQCSGAVVTNANLLDNGAGAQGGHGLQVVGGTDLNVSNVRAEGNAYGGLALGGGANLLRIGPNVTTRGFSGAQDIGIAVRNATAVTIVDCSFGPAHSIAALLAPEGNAGPTNVTFCRCTMGGSQTGLSVLRSLNTLVCASTIAGNTGDGVLAVGATLATGPRTLVIADCQITANAGDGVRGQTVDGLQIGPGNRLDDNLFAGFELFGCANVQVTDNLSIDRNRNTGGFIADCTGAAVARCSLRDNRGTGIYALRCTGLSIGPDVSLLDTVGSGIRFDACNGCRVVSSQIRGNTAHGLHTIQSFGSAGNTPHLLQSCLIADHPGLALFHSGGPPLICELCTVAGNLRGVNSGPNPITLESCIVAANTLEDLQQSATALTVRNTFHQIPTAVPSSTNSSTDPRFVSPAAKDWRLQANSPAVGYANQAVVVAPGGLDAFLGPRVLGAIDAGAYEVGPHPAATNASLLLSAATMAHGGGGLAFHVQYPTTTAGSLSILLMEFGAPSGSFPAFGAQIPLGFSPALLTAAQDPNSVGTVAVLGADGLATGALLWAGRIPASVQNQIVSLCAVAPDLSPMVRSVSSVATFVIQ